MRVGGEDMSCALKEGESRFFHLKYHKIEHTAVILDTMYIGVWWYAYQHCCLTSRLLLWPDLGVFEGPLNGLS